MPGSKLPKWGETPPVDFKKAKSFRVWQTNNILQTILKTCLDEFELTYIQYLVMASLVFDMQMRAMNQKQIATMLGIDIMTASQVLRKLEQKRFLIRTKSIIDGRAVSLRATSEGIGIVNIAQKAIEDHAKQVELVVETIS